MGDRHARAEAGRVELPTLGRRVVAAVGRDLGRQEDCSDLRGLVRLELAQGAGERAVSLGAPALAGRHGAGHERQV